jgi:hypothetical protein
MALDQVDLALPSWISSVSAVTDHFASNEVSFTEEEALRAGHWELGEDARLREDIRFRPTPWDRWILSQCILANDALYKTFIRSKVPQVQLSEVLGELKQVTDRTCVFCPGDPRFVLTNNTIRLAASELSQRPLLEDPDDLAKYMSHLPVHSLEAVAASEPEGDWGPQAQEQLIETLGWVQVTLPEHRLNDRMFVAQIIGHSMDDGRSGLKDGSYAVFELWPAVSRQGRIVLVKGSFNDPETGSYSVKKYDADERDAEGRHGRITLISQNPDKEKYPDIELQPESDEDIRVIARLISPLSTSQYAQQAKLPRRRGRRDLESEEGQSRIAERMRQASQRIFEDMPGETSEKTGVEPQVWQARFVCLDAESGGLHIETEPLVELPPFAKKLVVSADDHTWTVLGSNLRNRVWKTSVVPSTKPYLWTAPGHEEMLSDELAQLQLEGLPDDAVTAFRVDALGIGRSISGHGLSPGQQYRLLIPPALPVNDLPDSERDALEGGWQLWEFEVPVNPDIEYRNELEALGLQLGKALPKVSWTVQPPACYRQSLKGDVYPCFALADTPTLIIDGVTTLEEGELTVFLMVQEELVSLPLSGGQNWMIHLNDLKVGQYVLDVIHSRTRFDIARMPFMVAGVSSPLPKAHVEVRMGEQITQQDESGLSSVEEDLSCIGDEEHLLEVNLPPLWSIFANWNGVRRTHFGTIHADREGLVDTDSLVSRITEHAKQEARGDVELDCGELGLVRLCHDRERSPDELIDRLTSLIAERATNAEALIGQFALIRSVWLDPITEVLGYRIETPSEESLLGAPQNTTIFLLFEVLRGDNGEVKKELCNILVVVGIGIDIQEVGEGSVRAYADTQCVLHDTREALITDGLRWARHRRGARFPLHEWDLRDLASPSAEERLSHFISECGIGV